MQGEGGYVCLVSAADPSGVLVLLWSLERSPAQAVRVIVAMTVSLSLLLLYLNTIYHEILASVNI